MHTSSEESDTTDYNGTSDSVRQYLREIHRFPLLSHKETLRLVRLVQNGDAAARETLINCNLRFAFSMATKYVCTGLPLLDLVQQANIGLMTAVDKYNPNRGTKFTTYSVFWIKQAILSYIEDQSRLIKLPGYINTALKKIKTVQEEYYREHRAYPSDDEIATITGFSIARVKHLNTLEYSMASLDSPSDDEMDGTLLDTVKDENTPDPIANLTIKERRDAIEYFINQLPPREKQVIALRFGLTDQRHHSLEETGQIMNLTPERVRQIESMALNKIRNMKSSNMLRKYMKA